MREQTLTTPLAILVGGALIGLGLFLGLRVRPANPPPTVSTGRDMTVDPSGVAPSHDSEGAIARPGATPVSTAPTASKTTVVEQATAAIEAYRAKLVTKCWEPAALANPKPATSNFVFNFAFDAAGHQIIRGITEERGTGRPTVTACVSQSLPVLQIPAPGAPTSVEVPFHLP